MEDYELFPLNYNDPNDTSLFPSLAGVPDPGGWQNYKPQPGLNIVNALVNGQPTRGFQFDDSVPADQRLIGYDPKGNLSVLTDPTDIRARRADARTRGLRESAKIGAMIAGANWLSNTPWSTGANEGLQTGTGSTAITDSFLGSTAPEVGAGATGAGAAGAEGLTGVTLPASASYISPLTAGVGTAADSAAVGVGTGAGGGGGILSQIKNLFGGKIKNPDGSINWNNAIKLGSGAATMLGSLVGPRSAQTTPTMPAGWNDPAQFLAMNRERAPAMAPEDYATYGTKGGEHRFFTDPVYTRRAFGGNVRGPGSGRSDDIDAKLSDGEYVFDAESVALLGDGSLDEGSRRLDQLRANLRKHKGRVLAKGKFSPAAKDPMHYMGKAKGGVVLPHVDVPLRNKQLLTRVLERQPPKLGSLSDSELETYRRWLESVKNMAPPAKAKGGRFRLIPGGITEDPAIRLEQLAAAQRMAAALRNQQRPEMAPVSPAIQADRAYVDAARERLKRIQALAGQTPPPVGKAEGGAVKDLTEFADRLENEVNEPAIQP